MRLVRLIGNPLYHAANVSFVALSWPPRWAEPGGPPANMLGWLGQRIAGETAAAGEEDQDDDTGYDQDTTKKRGGHGGVGAL